MRPAIIWPLTIDSTLPPPYFWALTPTQGHSIGPYSVQQPTGYAAEQRQHGGRLGAVLGLPNCKIACHHARISMPLTLIRLSSHEAAWFTQEVQEQWACCFSSQSISFVAHLACASSCSFSRTCLKYRGSAAMPHPAATPKNTFHGCADPKNVAGTFMICLPFLSLAEAAISLAAQVEMW